MGEDIDPSVVQHLLVRALGVVHGEWRCMGGLASSPSGRNQTCLPAGRLYIDVQRKGGVPGDMPGLFLARTRVVKLRALGCRDEPGDPDVKRPGGRWYQPQH